LAGFVESHGRAPVLVILGQALAGVVLTVQIPISNFPRPIFRAPSSW
jgi:hypothetical protein